jgi:hypothetical protein
MGIENQHVRQHERSFFAMAQTTLDTMVRAASAGAVKILAFSAEYDQARAERKHNRTTRGRRGAVSGQRTISWSLEKELIPSGAAGTAPDDQEFWQSAFGTETINGGVSAVYSLSTTQAMQLLSIHDYHPAGVMQSLIGAWVDTLKIAGSGADPLKVSMTGGARRLVQTGRTTVDGIVTTSATVVVDDEYQIEPDSIVQVGANTNTSTGYRVISNTAGTLVLEATLSVADAADVVPFAPAETTAGTPLAGIDGSLTVLGAACPVTAWEVEINNSMIPHDGEYGAVHVSDVSPGWRQVSGTFTFRLRRDLIGILSTRKNSDFAAQAVTIVCGGTAGRTLTISMPQVELGGVLKIDHADDGGPSTVTMAFVADESTDSANDAVTATWT